MKLRLFCVFSLALIISTACRAADGDIDVLDYFLQSPGIAAHDTIGGVNVHSCPDPDGGHAQAYILHKFSSSNSYEVYLATGDELQIRYEVFRPNARGSRNNWIRRYHDSAGDAAPAAGMLWMPRYITPGKTEFLARGAVERYDYDPSIDSYIIKPAESDMNAVSFGSVVWSTDPWRGNNHTGIPINSVIRLISQWQRDGKIFECYEYGKGLGLINWQWNERISDLPPVAGDKTGKLFQCENGAVYVQSPGGKTIPPSVFEYDLKKQRIEAALPVMLFTSHWKKEMGPQWYVTYRDLAREGMLSKKRESLKMSFALPEWRTHPGATIADLPWLSMLQP